MSTIKKGIVYIAKANNIKNVKIGYWTGSLKSLRSRYVSYYGDDVNFTYAHSDCVLTDERSFKRIFKSCHIKNEIYDKNYKSQFYTFLNKIAIDGIVHRYVVRK